MSRSSMLDDASCLGRCSGRDVGQSPRGLKLQLAVVLQIGGIVAQKGDEFGHYVSLDQCVDGWITFPEKSKFMTSSIEDFSSPTNIKITKTRQN